MQSHSDCYLSLDLGNNSNLGMNYPIEFSQMYSKVDNAHALPFLQRMLGLKEVT